ncbi:MULTISPECIES: hypothetical protein [Thermus]|uniref:Ribbon-helix-helix protein, CopG family n=1 Tax=Thermus tengchongensis TaxID=1214928 RepID=A0A4Y9EV27_9DEIN|nr:MULTISPECIES: hypothetical protein [Thermus]TFU15556.1 hypothetical protein E0489_09140 [Thermus tengchongensis]TFU26071.1 hypothetical protein E0687_07710 [Thermus tengchongensis]
MARRKTTLYLEEEVLRAAKVRAASLGLRESELVERALRHYLGLERLEALLKGPLSEEEALKLAYQELHASRG